MTKKRRINWIDIIPRIVRVIGAFARALKKDSDGGRKITKEEFDIILGVATGQLVEALEDEFGDCVEDDV